MTPDQLTAVGHWLRSHARNLHGRRGRNTAGMIAHVFVLRHRIESVTPPITRCDCGKRWNDS